MKTNMNNITKKETQYTKKNKSNTKHKDKYNEK